MEAVEKLYDKAIRSALARLVLSHDPTTVIHNELPLARGDGRADVAAVNGSLVGYEIKSEMDTLSRLEHQIPLYDSVFDYCYLVVTSKHLAAATPKLPTHWGIYRAEWRGATVRLVRSRAARSNRGVVLHNLARLLWKPEVLKTLKKHGLPAQQNESVLLLWERLNLLGVKQLKLAVREFLKVRVAAQSPALPQIPCDG